MSSASIATEGTESPRTPEIAIRPVGELGSLRIAEIWRYRELLYFLTKRQIQIRYKQSFIGIGWAILQPVVLTFVFALFLGRLASVGSEGIPYPVFALTALVPWLFFSQSLAQASVSLVADSELLTKVYFPRSVIPVSRVLALLVDLAVALVVVIVFAVLYGVSIQQNAPLVLLFLGLALLAAIGMSLLFAALNVRYRDVQVVVPLLVQVWLFATPVVYPGSLITGAWQYLYAVNPLVSVIQGVRWTLLGTPAPDVAVVGISVAVAVLILGAAVLYFSRTEASYADII